jgi:precorrin-2 dehydrogenase/sirohydrochlorin ferrochelatase
VKTYPVFLVKLENSRCVVVGGGQVAARKVTALRRACAQITIISPSLCESLEKLAGQGNIEVVDRDYRQGDLLGAFLVVAATDDRNVNRQVWEEARTRNLLVNVVDDPEHCNFIAPSVVRQGPLSLAISTSGQCPAYSRHLRRRLESEFGPAYARYVELLGDLRGRIVNTLTMAERRDFWQKIFESDVLSLFVSGDDGEARRRAEAILEQHMDMGS